MENIWNELKQPLDYKWRVQGFFPKENPTKCRCVAYVDSRDVQNRLDEAVGPANWQDEYQEIAGNLYCRIGIHTEFGWVWKGDCGTVSKEDPEKGQASDAFKRAAVKWGIGRFLYSLGLVTLNAKKEGNYKNAVDDNGKKIWDINEHIKKLGPSRNQMPKPAPKQQNTPPPSNNHQATSDEISPNALKAMDGCGQSVEALEVKREEWRSKGMPSKYIEAIQTRIDGIKQNPNA